MRSLPLLARSTPSLLCLLALSAAACGDDDGTGTSTTGGDTCDPATLAFETGSDTGHADPFGAKSAGQARAGRVSGADIVQPLHGRQRIEDGDFVLANDHIAVYIEDKDVSDGYGRFGGEIISVDRVGEDGRPVGQSMFVETLQLLSLFMVNPSSVTVLADGSDGGAAIVRVAGKLEALPFLAETFGAAFPQTYAGLDAAYDFVLEPGAEKLVVRFGLANTYDYELDSGVSFEGSDELQGFFQGSFNDMFTPGYGFGKASGSVEFVGFENDGLGFAYQGPDGGPLDFGGIDISGFQVFTGAGFLVPPCTSNVTDRHQIIVAEAPGIDSLREAIRRVNDEAPWRAVSGTVTDAEGAPVAAALVHALDSDGGYVTRAVTDEAGNYTLHLPDDSITLVPHKRGYPVSDGIAVDAGASSQDLSFDDHAVLHVTAIEEGTTTNLPVRIQVIPSEAQPETPESYGIPDEERGRLHQEFAERGDATLAVPPGEHRVIVSRGPEWELLDTTVTVAGGDTLEVPAALVQSVDTTGAMSADFHIHSYYSADSSDPVIYKVRGAVADGLDIPVSSEHEWIVDFQPIIEDLGIEDFAFGMPAEELTTFTWGHFGVVPIMPRPGELNNGAIDWLGKTAKEVFAEVDALPEKPAFIIHHPSGGTAFSSYFTAVDLNRATGSSEHPLWDENFDAVEVYNDSSFDSNRDESVADYFSILNSGKKKFTVGSSDSHNLRTSPVGYPRTYLMLGYDDPASCSADDVRDAVKAGTSTISGGLYMSVEGPGGSAPGATIPGAGSDVEFTITVQSASWVDADTLEIIVNGETVATEDLLPMGAGPGKRFVNQVTVPIPQRANSWVIFHAKGPGDLDPVNPGKDVFAVSNPIFFE